MKKPRKMRRPRNPVERALVENPLMRTRIERPKRGKRSYDRLKEKETAQHE